MRHLYYRMRINEGGKKLVLTEGKSMGSVAISQLADESCRYRVPGNFRSPFPPFLPFFHKKTYPPGFFTGGGGYAGTEYLAILN